MSFSQDFCELLNNFPLVLGPRVSSPIPILTWRKWEQLSGPLSSSHVVSECPVVCYFTPTISSSLCRRVGTRSIECRRRTDCKALWLVIELVSREAGPRAAPPASKVQVITVCLNTSSSECDLWLFIWFNEYWIEGKLILCWLNRKHAWFQVTSFPPCPHFKSQLPESICLSESRCRLPGFTEIRLGSLQLS